MAAAVVEVQQRRVVKAVGMGSASVGCVLPLSPFDLVMRHIPHSQALFFFSHKPGASAEMELEAVVSKLQSSLSQVLVHFLPLAGRVESDSIHCNNAGAELLVARTEMAMAELGPEMDSSPIFGALVPQSNFPALLVQVTRFSCGGIAIGCAVSHVVADGTSLWHFVTCWSEVARGKALSLAPCHHRVPPDSRFPAPVAQAAGEAWEWATQAEIRHRRMRVSKEAVGRMKAEAGEEFTSFQSLCAHCWKHVTQARGLQGDQEVRFYVSVDCRKRMEPAMAAGYFGNAVVSVCATSTAEEISRNGIGYAAGLLREAIAGATGSRIREEVERSGEKGYPSLLAGFRPAVHLGAAGSPKFPRYQSDFGWGRPDAVRFGRYSSYLDGLLYFHAAPRPGDIDITMSLYPDTIAKLAADPHFLQ